jgi:hypothetical protein
MHEKLRPPLVTAVHMEYRCGAYWRLQTERLPVGRGNGPARVG